MREALPWVSMEGVSSKAVGILFNVKLRWFEPDSHTILKGAAARRRSRQLKRSHGCRSCSDIRSGRQCTGNRLMKEKPNFPRSREIHVVAGSGQPEEPMRASTRSIAQTSVAQGCGSRKPTQRS